MKDWLKNIEMQTWFILIIFLILSVSSYTNFDPTNVILLLSTVFITFPLILLGFFVVPSMRKNIKKSYGFERAQTLFHIDALREKEKKLEEREDIEGLINLDRQILSLRENMRALKDNRFERCIFSSLILFMITIVLVFFDFGSYIDMSNIIFVVIFFMSGLYYIFQMIQSILYSFEVEGLFEKK